MQPTNVTNQPQPFQARVRPWMLACFGPEVSADRVERGDRFIEEALELVQAIGYSPARAHALVDYVFGRPVGEPHQEVGGVMITLAALCLTCGLDIDRAAEDELARVWKKVDAIRAKQAAKPTGSALPIAQPEPHPDDIAVDTFVGVMAAAMKAKLAAKRAQGFGGWNDPALCTVETLSGMLRKHVAKGDPVDVANLAMMIHHHGAAILPDDDGAMTPEEIRLENLRQMANYDGPIVSFEVAEGYYLASCDKCGWVGSSQNCGKDYGGDDSDVYCPRCFASGADCGKIAEHLAIATPQPPAPANGGDESEACPICAKPLTANDLCATDITEGICHAECLQGAAVVDLDTGEPKDGPMDTYRYGNLP